MMSPGRKSYASLQAQVERLSRELSEALRRQTATAEVLEVISRSPTDLQKVLDTIAESAARLCETDRTGVLLLRGNILSVVAGLRPGDDVPLTLANPATVGPLDRNRTVADRAIVDREVIHVPDLAAAPIDELADNYLRHVGVRTLLAVPLLRQGAGIGVIRINRYEVRPFSEQQIALVKTFADQAVIAIENARLFQELEDRNRHLAEALAQQTAIREILEVIASSPTDVQPVLDAVVSSAEGLLGDEHITLALVDGDELVFRALSRGALLRVAEGGSEHGPPIGTRGLLTGQRITGRAVLDRRTIHLPDVQNYVDPEDPEVFASFARRSGVRSHLAVPLLQADRAIGCISVRRFKLQPFTDREITLLETFARQAAIAVANTNLFHEVQQRNRELAEALEQQTATADILRVIASSPTDLPRVLQAIATGAKRLCVADEATVVRGDGGEWVFAAYDGFISPGTQSRRVPREGTPPADSVGGLAIASKRTIHVGDALGPEGESYPASRQLAQAGRARTFLAAPLLRDGSAVGVLNLRRREARPFSDQQIRLLEMFADQAVIAIENSRLLHELRQRLDERTATTEVLEAISRSPTDLQRVLDTITASAARLWGGRWASIFRVVGNEAVFAAHLRDGEVRTPPAYPLPLSREWVAGRTILDQRTLHVPDLAAALDEFPLMANRQHESGFHTVLATPLLRNGAAIGAIHIALAEVRPFSPDQIALLESFADQAVIAIENARLFQELTDRNRDLAESLEQQTATADILRVIASSPTDLPRVLDAIAAGAMRLCAADDAVIHRREGGDVVLAAHVGSIIARPVGTRVAFTDMATGTVLRAAYVSKRVAHVGDLLGPEGETYPDSRLNGQIEGARTLLAAPLLREGQAAGMIGLRRIEALPFTDQQIRLLETFADQAVIAIENARLIDELKQRLEEQSATAEIVRIIASAPADQATGAQGTLGKTLQSIAETAARLCGAEDVQLMLLDGEFGYTVAHFGPYVASAVTGAEYTARFPLAGSVTGMAIRESRTVHVPDLAAAAAEFPYTHANLYLGQGFRTIACGPLMRAGKAIGSFFLRHKEVRPFTDRQLRLLETFADQAVIAIANAELFEQLQKRTRELADTVEQLRAVFQVSQTVSSTLDLGALLDTVAARAVELSGADGGGIFELDGATRRLHLRTVYRHSEELTDVLRRAPLRVGEGVTGRAVATRQPVQVPDATVEGAYQSSVRDILLRSGYRALLAVPLLREHQVLGALFVNRAAPGEFAPETVELLKTFASQSAVALQNARLFQELAEKNEALELAGRHKSQFLANMSHELRTPLNAILGYTELILDSIYGTAPEAIRDILGRVEASGRHLLGLINAVLDLAKIEAGQLNLSLAGYALAEVVQTVAASVGSLAAEKGLALELLVAPDLPPGHGDERRISQVLLNLVGNAIKFTEAGAVRVEASAADGQFVVAVSDTGPGIAPADQQRIFEEFQQLDASSTREQGGTGLGLAIARRIVELHGGRVWVESEVGRGSTFTFAIPVRVTSDG